MRYFVLKKQVSSQGNYELHQLGCSKISEGDQIDHLGNLFSCHAALFTAKKLHGNVNGCPDCASECHVEVTPKAEETHLKDLQVV